MNEMTSIYPTTMYRVSLKAVITNKEGKLLCVKENGSDWTLPGGGLEHGETVKQGLDRELHEELEFKAGTPYAYAPLGHDIMFVPSKQVWQLLVLFRVTFKELPDFSPGVDGDAVAFMNPAAFKDSEWRMHQVIYRWCGDLK